MFECAFVCIGVCVWVFIILAVCIINASFN